MKQKIQGTMFLLFATILWGASFVPQRMGMDHIGPFTFQAVRCMMGVVGMLPVIWLFDRRKQDGKNFLTRFLDKKLLIAGVYCGVALCLAANLQQLGIVTTDSGKSAFLTAMYIVFVPFVGLLFRKKPNLLMGVSVVIAVVGLYFLSCVGSSTIESGDILLLCCAVAFALQITFVDKYAGEVDPLRLNCLQALVCAIGASVPMFLTETVTLEGLQSSWGAMCYSGFVSMGIAYSLQILGQQKVEPTVASLIMSLEAVFAVLFGWLLLQESMNMWEIIGCILVFVAVIISQIPIPHKKK